MLSSSISKVQGRPGGTWSARQAGESPRSSWCPGAGWLVCILSSVAIDTWGAAPIYSSPSVGPSVSAAVRTYMCTGLLARVSAAGLVVWGRAERVSTCACDSDRSRARTRDTAPRMCTSGNKSVREVNGALLARCPCGPSLRHLGPTGSRMSPP